MEEFSCFKLIYEDSRRLIFTDVKRQAGWQFGRQGKEKKKKKDGIANTPESWYPVISGDKQTVAW